MRPSPGCSPTARARHSRNGVRRPPRPPAARRLPDHRVARRRRGRRAGSLAALAHPRRRRSRRARLADHRRRARLPGPGCVPRPCGASATSARGCPSRSSPRRTTTARSPRSCATSRCAWPRWLYWSGSPRPAGRAGVARRPGPAVRRDRGRVGLQRGRGAPARRAGPADRRRARAAAPHACGSGGRPGPVRRRDGPRRPRRAGRPCCTRTRCWSTTAAAGCSAARREVVGADKVARLLLGLMARYGSDAMLGVGPVLLVNGELGVFVPGRGRACPPSVTVVAVRDGRIVALLRRAQPREAGDARQASANPWSVMPSAWLNRARWFSSAIAWVSSTSPARPSSRLQRRDLVVGDGHRLRRHRVRVGDARGARSGVKRGLVGVLVDVLEPVDVQARRGAAAWCRSRRTRSSPPRSPPGRPPARAAAAAAPSRPSRTPTPPAHPPRTAAGGGAAPRTAPAPRRTGGGRSGRRACPARRPAPSGTAGIRAMSPPRVVCPGDETAGPERDRRSDAGHCCLC